MKDRTNMGVGIAKPRVLLAVTKRWGLPARLAISLAEVGCEVFAVCPPKGNPLAKTKAVSGLFPYNGFWPSQSLMVAIRAANPDLIVPCCDRSMEHLHSLFRLAKSEGDSGRKIATLIEYSIGPFASYESVSSRIGTWRLARDTGIRVPDMQSIGNSRDVCDWRVQHPFPWVLKTDGTSGGDGIAIVQNDEEVARSLKRLERLSGLGRSLKRFVVNRDSFGLLPWFKGVKRGLTVQTYIKGVPANCAVLAWQGTVLALTCVEVLRSRDTVRPASIIRVIENEEMMQAATRIAARLEISGFFGLDFVLEEKTGAPFFIEMNPRATPPCHLRLGYGHDLAASLGARLSGVSKAVSSPVTTAKTIAYFPDGITDVPAGLPDLFLDMPEGETELVRELLNPFPDRTFLFRLVQRLHRARGVPAALQLPEADEIVKQAHDPSSSRAVHGPEL